jgi:opacity protein-like surface antigen
MKVLQSLTVRIALFALLGAGLATEAAAQTTAAPLNLPRWFVGGGLGRMEPLHGDDYDEGTPVFATIGARITKTVILEAEVTRRAHTEAYVQEPVFLYGGINGIHGRADRSELGRGTKDWTVGINALGHVDWRALSLYAGPGVVWHREDLRNYRTVTNCTPPIPSNGFECREFDTTTSDSDIGYVAMAGVEVRAHRNLSAFVAGRYELRGDLGMGTVGVIGGLRVGIR